MVRYSVGIVGCGGIGRDHAQNYLKIPGVKVVSGAELDAEKSESFQREFGAERMYPNYEEMLEKEELDIVSVCTWPTTHCEVVLRAAESGAKAIMCEKPLAVNLDEADRMVEACDRSGIVLATGHQHRFDPQFVKARELIDLGEIGDPVLFWSHCSLDLMNNGSHVADMLNYLNGDRKIEWVIGQIDRRHKTFGQANHPDLPVEDTALGHIKYENGLEAVIELGEFAPQNWQFHLYGSGGMIDVNLPGGPQLRFISEKSGGWVIPDLEPVNSRLKEMEELISAIEHGREHLSSGRKGKAALEIAIAIFESSRRRALINFPAKVKDFPLQAMIDKGEV